jgi:hypothetical protein
LGGACVSDDTFQILERPQVLVKALPVALSPTGIK